MSGSIGGHRIKREQVRPTLDRYEKEVMSGFPGYQSLVTTGSYNAGTKKDHGDIDVAVYIKAEDVKQTKKDFQNYLKSLPDDVTVPFLDGKRKGQKAQLFGAIVTCLFPIAGEKNRYVQIDNIICTTEKDQNFQKQFLDWDAAKQGLITGLVRVCWDRINQEAVLKKFGLENLPQPESNQEFEFVISPAGLSFRLVTLSAERKEEKRVELWRSTDWDDVEYLLKDFDITGSYEDVLHRTAKIITDRRSRDRILGLMKSLIKVGPGEVGTPKGDGKIKAIETAEKILNEHRLVSLKEYVMEKLNGNYFLNKSL